MSKDAKEAQRYKIWKNRSFSKKKVAVLDDSNLGGLAFCRRKDFISLHLGLRSFHNCCTKVVSEKLKEYVSEVLELPLENPAEMRG